MAFTFKGGETVKAGEYWDLYSGERVSLAAEGTLPGGDGVTFTRLPTVVVLLLAPIAGLLYAIFLPFIGIAFVVDLGARALLEGAGNTLGQAASFNWRPSEAYLLGKKTEKKEQSPEQPRKDDGPSPPDGGKSA